VAEAGPAVVNISVTEATRATIPCRNSFIGSRARVPSTPRRVMASARDSS
jgi:hypothetical protein